MQLNGLCENLIWNEQVNSIRFMLCMITWHACTKCTLCAAHGMLRYACQSHILFHTFEIIYYMCVAIYLIFCHFLAHPIKWTWFESKNYFDSWSLVNRIRRIGLKRIMFWIHQQKQASNVLLDGLSRNYWDYFACVRAVAVFGFIILRFSYICIA